MSEQGTPDRLDLGHVSTIGELRSALRQLAERFLRGKKLSFSYRTLARELNRPHGGLWDHLNSDKMITPAALDALVIDLDATAEEQRAFTRAYERILQRREDTKPDPASIVPTLPYANPKFVGTAAERQLIELLRSAAKPRSARVFLITGMAGVGKSTLAIQVSHSASRRFRDVQLHVDLRGFGPDASQRMPAEEALAIMLETLGVPTREIPAGVVQRAAMYRKRLHGRRALIIVDNAYDASQVRHLLPGSRTCVVLVTSRELLEGLLCEGAQLVELGEFTADEALQLFENHLGSERTAEHRPAVEELIGLCARLPLALSVVAARAVAQPAFPLDVFAAELRERGLDAFATADPRTTVRTVFSWSLDHLRWETRDAFHLLGLHPAAGFGKPAAASLAGISPQDAHQALDELVRAHLLDAPAPGRFAFHDLMHQYAREHAVDLDEAERRQAVDRMLGYYLHTANAAAHKLNQRPEICLHPSEPGVVPEKFDGYERALGWFKREYPALKALINEAMDAQRAVHAWQITWTLADFLDRQGLWQDMADTHLTALKAARQLGDLDAQARTHGGLARAFLRLRQYEESLHHAQATRDLFEELVNPNGQANAHRSAAQALEYDGYRHRQDRRDDQARALFQQALAHAEQALALAQVEGVRAHALNLTGWCHALLGNFPEALERCTYALDSHREEKDIHGEAAASDSLGYIHYHRGDYSASADWYSTAADLFGTLDDQYKKAETLGRLADAFRAAGDLNGERRALRERLEILDRMGSTLADDTRTRLIALAAAQ